MELFSWIWLGLGFAIVIAGCVGAGYMKTQFKSDREGIIVTSVFLAIMWPVALVLLVALAPFYGLYKLGELLRNNRQ